LIFCAAFLSLGINSFTGTIPNELGLLSNLCHLALSVNQLTGTVPTTLASLPLLSKLTQSLVTVTFCYYCEWCKAISIMILIILFDFLCSFSLSLDQSFDGNHSKWAGTLDWAEFSISWEQYFDWDHSQWAGTLEQADFLASEVESIDWNCSH
jgi:hypothetical protein